ncbi:hypothetical protein PENSPDRAFT_679820 [Peniophora sp. CONT]|nr:hypothetical protein PENSPDRAFT_679820 [Peniophora sp. CONT]
MVRRLDLYGGDRLEQLVLSGELFAGPASRTASPTRSASPDAAEAEWPPSGADADDSEYEYSSKIGKGHIPVSLDHGEDEEKEESIGMGPGRTGVKGVIRDRAEAERRKRDRARADASALAARMEKASLGGLTFNEEQALAQRDRAGEKRSGRFGHLREVGANGFLHAIEDEQPSTWVVIHIYEPGLDRCDELDDALVRFARVHPDTKFLRARASALGFASTPKKPRSNGAFRRPTRTIREVDDEDDPYGAPEEDEDGGEEVGEDVEVDTDMLPTMHIYRGGDLVHNWVRVDWEAGPQGLEDLLARHRVIEGGRGAAFDDEENVMSFSGVL